jgi:hypothetical protein
MSFGVAEKVFMGDPGLAGSALLASASAAVKKIQTLKRIQPVSVVS